MKYLIAVGLLVLGISCSSSDKPGVLSPQEDGGAGGLHPSGHAGAGGRAGNMGSSGDGGSRGEEIGGSAGAAGSEDAGSSGEAGGGGEATTPAPVIAIVSPLAAGTPNDVSVLIGDQATNNVTVLCTAKASTQPGALPLKTDSVKIALLDSDGVQKLVHSAIPTTNAGEFSTTFNLGAAPSSDAPVSGKVSFKCSASDTSLTPSVGAATIATFLDHGPSIAVTQPIVASKNPLGTLGVDFSVNPALLAPGDAASEIDKVTFTINGIAVPLPAPDLNGHYVLTVDLTMFSTPPTGASVPLLITASNKRKPKAATATNQFPIAIDGTPPVVSISAPAQDSVVGQQITLKFTVTDDLTGVVPTSIYVLLNNQKYFYPGTNTAGWTQDSANNLYTFTFPSTLIPDPKVQGSPSVRATDAAGNTSGGVSRNFYFDTMPPLVDLDPKPLRTRIKQSNTFYCSDSFDPLGPGSPNDKDTVGNAPVFRVFAWDQTNTIPGLDPSQFHYAALEPSSVVIYALQGDANSPLLKKSPIDDSCVLNTDTAKVQTLAKIDPTGSAVFSATPANAIDGICSAPATPTAGSAKQCGGSSDLTVSVRHLGANGLADPAVFGIGTCGSNIWVLPTAVATADGWICMVAKATDKAGNVGFSRPMHVCLDSDLPGFSGSPPCTDPVASPPPSCTDGCTPPARIDLGWIDQ